ncbi:AraC family transcriptional regulator [Pantoea ananatis]|uniref:AraC family transcriptional regulator n=1 Tax=Pantoea ananas TaxID=553 RepID=UPI0023507208|nr:helix-turn-helix transcriptional regulator [Pantoea ananatis]
MTDPLISLSRAHSSDGPTLIVAARQSDAIRETPRHRHIRGQLLGAEHGLLTIDAEDCRWVVPATHAVWIPPNIPHGLRSHGPYSGWSVYISTAACGALPDKPAVLTVTNLLREAITRAASWKVAELNAPQKRLSDVILDEIASLPSVNLGLAMPQDVRLLKVALMLSKSPDDGRTVEEWAFWVGVSSRTLTRRFKSETGFSFNEWRQRIRLLKALELLAAGKQVTTVALELGYDNVSAFIAMFRKVFGTTPARFRM